LCFAQFDYSRSHSVLLKRGCEIPTYAIGVILQRRILVFVCACGLPSDTAVPILSRWRIRIVTVGPLSPPLTAWRLHQDLCIIFMVIRTVDGIPYRSRLRNVPREGGVFGLHLPVSAIWADQELFAGHFFSPVFRHFQPPQDSRCPGSLMKILAWQGSAGRLDCPFCG
jgi:hypothetical protein